LTLQELRDPSALKGRIQEIINLREVNGRIPRYKFRRIHKKFILVHELFTATDIHLFPNFVAAHKEGLKCAQFSAFDTSLWLTGGYDCIIRIHDIRAANNHICLSQYVGHRSIVTDVHFTREDTYIVSASFDRTVKIWNAQSASCERTLIGHTDSVTTCNVTPDGRYIASGSTDCTIRLWDFNNGECIAVIKKHTKWVKVVRFTQDGRYLITAGLDHKVYVWDTKILINSRAISHTRCIDAHDDYILDLATFRPTLLLTTSRDTTVKLFDYMTGHEIYSIILSPSWACTLAFSSDGEFFATGSFDNNIIIFRTKDGARVRQIRALNLGIMCVRFPRDLSCIVTGTVEGFLQQIPL
jgi:WD40 repeat protein